MAVRCQRVLPTSIWSPHSSTEIKDSTPFPDDLLRSRAARVRVSMMSNAGTILDVSPGRSAEERRRLESMGHQIVVCPGPGEGGRCPLVEDGFCPMLEAADGVVFRLDLDDSYHREMLGCYRSELGEGTPLHVVVQPGQRQRHGGLLSGLSVSVGEIGSDLDRLSAEVVMASAARSVLADVTDPSRRSAGLVDPRWS